MTAIEDYKHYAHMNACIQSLQGILRASGVESVSIEDNDKIKLYWANGGLTNVVTAWPEYGDGQYLSFGSDDAAHEVPYTNITEFINGIIDIAVKG